MITRLRVAGLVVDQGTLVFVEHRDQSGIYLSLPGGGVETGEKLEEALQREVLEETGLKVRPVKLVHVRQFSHSPEAPQALEVFFVAEPLGKSRQQRTIRERDALGEVVRVAIGSLPTCPKPILPEELRDIEWVLSHIRGPGITCSCSLGESPALSVGGDLVPQELRKALPDYFGTDPVPLQCESSFSGMGPLLVRNQEKHALVLRQYLPQHAAWTLKTVELLNAAARRRLGKAMWTELRGRNDGQPWLAPTGRAILLQDYCPKHDPRMLAQIRDFDVLALGRQCGNIMKLTAEVGPTNVPAQLEGHPQACPIAQRLAIVEQRIESGNLPEFDAKFRRQLLEESHRTVSQLRSLGAGAFPAKLVDRDLNVGNATLQVNTGGVCEISSIFDPDFCVGSIADALRNPARSFSSDLPRLSIDDILRNDLRTVGNPKWRLFLKGFLETCPLSREEILAIPIFEKLEILIYRLFEDLPRYSIPFHYRRRFRELVFKQVQRLNHLSSDGSLRAMASRAGTSCFWPVEHLEPDERRFEPAFTALRFRRRSLLAKSAGAAVDLTRGFLVAATKASRGRGRVILQDGFPFAVARSKAHIEPPSALRSSQITIYRHGEELREEQRRDLLFQLKSIRPDWTVKLLRVSPAKLTQIAPKLLSAGGSKVLLFDPFRYLGDSSYIALYSAMLRSQDPLCEVYLLTRNTHLWDIYDCILVDGADELPDQIDTAVLPAPIDDQWKEALCLLEPTLERCDHVLFPQRDLILVQDRSKKTLTLYHTGLPDTPLMGNIAVYTWWGMARLLRKPPSLESALRVFRSAFHHYAPREYHQPSLPTRILLNPFSSSVKKDLEPHFCQELARRLVSRLGRQITIWISCGNPANPRHRRAATSVAQAVQRHCVTQFVRDELENVLCAMTSMDLVVTADTSIAHLAAQKGVPTIVLWNSLRWNPGSPLEMMHNGPAGFSTTSHLQLDVCFSKSEENRHCNLQGDGRNFASALEVLLGLMGGARSWPSLSGDGGLSAIVDKTRMLHNLIYRTGAPERQKAVKVARDISESIRKAYASFRRGVKPLRYLEAQPVPIKPEYLCALLSEPSMAKFANSDQCLQYAYGLWRGHVLYKIIHLMTQQQAHSHEIEAKFLIAQDEHNHRDMTVAPHLGDVPQIRARVAQEGRDIKQGYLPESAFTRVLAELKVDPPFAPKEMRLRDDAGNTWLTVKGSGDLIRDELEAQVSGDFFKRHWPDTKGRRIHKRRWRTTFGEWVLEFDDYRDRALLVAEVTLPSREAYGLLPKLGRDVTKDQAFKNRTLAK